jgi:hypothetical protein
MATVIAISLSTKLGKAFISLTAAAKEDDEVCGDGERDM